LDVRAHQLVAPGCALRHRVHHGDGGGTVARDVADEHVGDGARRPGLGLLDQHVQPAGEGGVVLLLELAGGQGQDPGLGLVQVRVVVGEEGGGEAAGHLLDRLAVAPLVVEPGREHGGEDAQGDGQHGQAHASHHQQGATPRPGRGFCGFVGLDRFGDLVLSLGDLVLSLGPEVGFGLGRHHGHALFVEEGADAVHVLRVGSFRRHPSDRTPVPIRRTSRKAVANTVPRTRRPVPPVAGRGFDGAAAGAAAESVNRAAFRADVQSGTGWAGGRGLGGTYTGGLLLLLVTRPTLIQRPSGSTSVASNSWSLARGPISSRAASSARRRGVLVSSTITPRIFRSQSRLAFWLATRSAVWVRRGGALSSTVDRSPRAFFKLAATFSRSVSDWPSESRCWVTTWVNRVPFVMSRSSAPVCWARVAESWSPDSASWRRESVRPDRPVAASCSRVDTSLGGMLDTKALADLSNSENSRGTVVRSRGMTAPAVR